MLSRLVAILILAAILYFPGKFIFNSLKQSQQYKQAAQSVVAELEAGKSQLTIVDSSSASPAPGQNHSLPVQDSKQPISSEIKTNQFAESKAKIEQFFNNLSPV